jgi:hypothetical protein
VYRLLTVATFEAFRTGASVGSSADRSGSTVDDHLRRAFGDGGGGSGGGGGGGGEGGDGAGAPSALTLHSAVCMLMDGMEGCVGRAGASAASGPPPHLGPCCVRGVDPALPWHVRKLRAALVAAGSSDAGVRGEVCGRWALWRDRVLPLASRAVDDALRALLWFQSLPSPPPCGGCECVEGLPGGGAALASTMSQTRAGLAALQGSLARAVTEGVFSTASV